MPVISPGDYEPSPVPNSCAGCGTRISDRYYLQAVDRLWHVSCLTCCQCKVQLDSEKTCFAKDGQIYCREDYYRMFAVKRCARCQKGIFSNELVMRVRGLVFHLHCFTCAWCNSALPQGDYFGLRDDLVYCRTHYELIVRGENVYAPTTGDDSLGYPPTLIPHLSPMIPSETVEQPTSIEPLTDRPPLVDGNSFSTFTSVVSGRKGRPRKRKNVELRVEGLSPNSLAGISPMDAAACNLHLSQLDTSSAVSQHHHHQQQVSPPISGNNGQGGQRTKRMRTSFKHHQLRTMKSYFAINQNPDAKDLKQLAQKTGLSKRVLQVWFQNARAKWRRNNLKQQDSHLISSEQGSGGPHMHGGPHGSLSGMNSPGATSSFSESSPVPSCGGIPSDGPLSSSQTSGNPSLDFDGSNPMNPMMTTTSHHSMGAIHNGDATPIHMTSFHEMF